MRSSVYNNKKMVTNKRKSSISQTEPKAKSPKKDASAGPSPKGKAKPVRAQTSKAKTPAVPKKQIKAEPVSPPVTQSKPTLRKRGKQNGNENAVQSKFEKKTPVKNVLKKNKKPTLVKQEKVSDAKKNNPVKGEKPSPQKAKEEKPLPQKVKEVKPLPQKVKVEKPSPQKTKEEKPKAPPKEKAASSRRRILMREKFNDLREKIQKGNIEAIKEVEDVLKKIVDRGEMSRSAKRKLRAYRSLLRKTVSTTAPAKPPKGKKMVKKNK